MMNTCAAGSGEEDIVQDIGGNHPERNRGIGDLGHPPVSHTFYFYELLMAVAMGLWIWIDRPTSYLSRPKGNGNLIRLLFAEDPIRSGSVLVSGTGLTRQKRIRTIENLISCLLAACPRGMFIVAKMGKIWARRQDLGGWCWIKRIHLHIVWQGKHDRTRCENKLQVAPTICNLCPICIVLLAAYRIFTGVSLFLAKQSELDH